MYAIINGDMLNATTEPGEHVDWSTPDIMSEDEWTELLEQPVAEFAASNPHMIVWEVPVVPLADVVAAYPVRPTR